MINVKTITVGEIYLIFAAIIIILGILVFVEEMRFVYRHWKKKDLCILPWWYVKAMYGLGGLWMAIVFGFITYSDLTSPARITASLIVGVTDPSHASLVRPGVILLLSAIYSGAVITRKSRG